MAPYVEDARRHRHALGGAEEDVERLEDVASDIGNPYRGVPERIELRDGIGSGPGVGVVAEITGPHSGAGQRDDGHGRQPNDAAPLLRRPGRTGGAACGQPLSAPEIAGGGMTGLD